MLHSRQGALKSRKWSAALRQASASDGPTLNVRQRPHNFN
jgi:hypothetical protein